MQAEPCIRKKRCAATVYANLAIRGAGRVLDRGAGIVILGVAIEAAFLNVPMHVVQTPRVRALQADFSWMTVVEVNTFFLILKRHVQHPILELAFKASWAAIRVIWFPVVAVYFTFTLGGWGAGWLNLARRVSVSGSVCGLALLQLQWTWYAMVAPLLKRSSESPEEDADGGDDDKKGFL